MYIARILYPIKVLGPGNRVGIWFVGCNHFCKGCSNPELWVLDETYKTDVDHVMRLIRSISDQHKVDGFTITGGDPLNQAKALDKLLPMLEEISDDILIYTGYEYEKVKEDYADVLKHVAVLVDGLYVEKLNKGEILRGSTNQRIIVLKEAYREKYDSYISSNRSEIQNFTTPTGVISVGIHRPGYEKRLDDILKEKGLEKHG